MTEGNPTVEEAREDVIGALLILVVNIGQAFIGGASLYFVWDVWRRSRR